MRDFTSLSLGRMFVAAVAFYAPSALAGLSTPLTSVDAAWAQRALESAEELSLSGAPGLADAIATDGPLPSRNGQPLFTNPDWRVPEAAGALIVRIASGQDAPEARVGLLGALARTGGDWTEAVAGMAQLEEDALVRRMMVEVLRDAPIDIAREAVTFAVRDNDEDVRLAAIRVVGNHKQGAALADLVFPSLHDESAAVRAEAARSIGYAGITGAFDAIRALLADPDADVRFRALRTLQHLDAARAATLPELAQLSSDKDARIAREVNRLQGR